MQTEIKKWGNSLGVRLPKHIADSTELRDGSAVELTIEDGSVVIRPTRKKYRLEDLLKGHSEAQNTGETDWGEPEGEEAW